MKKILLLSLFSILVISCDSKKTSHSRSLYPEGFFSFNSQLYFSDGKQFYCTFKSWEHLYALRGSETKPEAGIINYDQLPEDMKFIKYCNIGILTKKFFE